MSTILRPHIFFKTLVCTFSLFLFSHRGVSQRVEIGTTIGLSDYVGDVAPSVVLSEVNPAFGAFLRLNLSTSFAWTNGVMMTRLSGSDQNFDFNKYRNITFRTDVFECSSVIEFNYLRYGTGVLDNRASFYIFSGINLIYYNPKFPYGVNWYSTRGKRTEGVKYSEYALGIPFGIGFKQQINRNVSFECQLGFRKMFTDYLDDVSNTYADRELQAQKSGIAMVFTDPSLPDVNGYNPNKVGTRRGNPDFDDWYMIAGVSLSYRFYGNVKCSRFY